jgi:cytochrome c
MVTGTKMSFPGLKKPQDIENVIAYLKATATK